MIKQIERRFKNMCFRTVTAEAAGSSPVSRAISGGKYPRSTATRAISEHGGLDRPQAPIDPF
jgi:hypothetical protein